MEKVIRFHVNREKMSLAENIFAQYPNERHSLGSVSNHFLL